MKNLFILNIIILTQIIIKFTFVIPFNGPIILFDEFYYKQISYFLFQYKDVYSTIYPPLYPLIISPSFYFYDNFYMVMKIINILITSFSLYGVWFISKILLNDRNSLLVVLLSSLLPFHYIYPKLIMSENLSYPIFIFLMYLFIKSFDSYKKNLTWTILAGLFAGLGLITRLYFVSVIIGFYIFYLFILILQKEKLKILIQLLTFTFTLLLISLPVLYSFKIFSTPYSYTKINSLSFPNNFKFENLVINENYRVYDEIGIPNILTFEDLDNYLTYSKQFEKNYILNNNIKNSDLLDQNIRILQKSEITEIEFIKLYYNRVELIKQLHSINIETNQNKPTSNNYEYVKSILNSVYKVSIKSILIHILHFFIATGTYYFLILVFVFVSVVRKTRFDFRLYIIFSVIFFSVLLSIFYQYENTLYNFMGRYTNYVYPLLLMMSLYVFEKYRHYLNIVKLKYFFSLLSILIIFISYLTFFSGKVFNNDSKYFIQSFNNPELYALEKKPILLILHFLLYISFSFYKKSYKIVFILLNAIFYFFVFLEINPSLDVYINKVSLINQSVCEKISKSNEQVIIFNTNAEKKHELIRKKYLTFFNYKNRNCINLEVESPKSVKIKGYFVTDDFYYDQKILFKINNFNVYETPFLIKKMPIYLLGQESKIEYVGRIDNQNPWGNSIIRLDDNTMFSTPGSSAIFHFTNNELFKKTLYFAIGYHPISKDWKISDGAVFKIILEDSKEKIIIFQREVMPQDPLKYFALTLNEKHIKNVKRIHFLIENLPNHNSSGDWLLWKYLFIDDENKFFYKDFEFIRF